MAVLDRTERKRVRWVINYLEGNRLDGSAQAVRNLLRCNTELVLKLAQLEEDIVTETNAAYCQGFDDAFSVDKRIV